MVGSGLVLTDNDAATAGRAGDRIPAAGRWRRRGGRAGDVGRAASSRRRRRSRPRARNVFYNAPKQSLEGSGVTVSDDAPTTARQLPCTPSRMGSAARRELGARVGTGAATAVAAGGAWCDPANAQRDAEIAAPPPLRAAAAADASLVARATALGILTHSELDGQYNAASRSRRGPGDVGPGVAGASSRLNARLEAAGKDAEHFFGERVNPDAGGAHRRFKNAGQHGREAAAAATATPWEGKAAPAGVWSDKVPVGVANFGEPGAERGRSPLEAVAMRASFGGARRRSASIKGAALEDAAASYRRESNTADLRAGQASRQSTDYKKALRRAAPRLRRRPPLAARLARRSRGFCAHRLRGASGGAAGRRDGAAARSLAGAQEGRAATARRSTPSSATQPEAAAAAAAAAGASAAAYPPATPRDAAGAATTPRRQHSPRSRLTAGGAARSPRARLEDARAGEGGDAAPGRVWDGAVARGATGREGARPAAARGGGGAPTQLALEARRTSFEGEAAAASVALHRHRGRARAAGVDQIAPDAALMVRRGSGVERAARRGLSLAAAAEAVEARARRAVRGWSPRRRSTRSSAARLAKDPLYDVGKVARVGVGGEGRARWRARGRRWIWPSRCRRTRRRRRRGCSTEMTSHLAFHTSARDQSRGVEPRSKP